MNYLKIYSIMLSALLITACHSSKKSTAPTAAIPANPSAPVTTGPALPMANAASGVFAPGSEELTAIQAKHKEITMQTLTEGYAIYTGACTNCHRAKSIYNRPEEKWQGIMDNMAPKANLNDKQKDAVYSYVLAIKATQPK